MHRNGYGNANERAEFSHVAFSHVATPLILRYVNSLELGWFVGKASSQTFLSEHAREYLPSRIFVYYSGKNERLEPVPGPPAAVRPRVEEESRRACAPLVLLSGWYLAVGEAGQQASACQPEKA